jgi:UDP-galactopyranose mutase
MIYDLIVFSHLRWDFVYQRPQHLMSRFATAHRVIFFEEPVLDESTFLECKSHGNVLVCIPHTTEQASGFRDQQLPYLNTLLENLVRDENLKDYVAWFYTPMALPLLQVLQPRSIIYDCMDELSAFLNVPRQLLQRETALLKTADLVFTGGPSLYNAKKGRNPNVHCFSSSVDAAHFAQARRPAIESELQQSLPHPRLGFFGVIDERINLELIDDLAAAHPEWQIIMVGPVVKISPDTLPRQPNIHYFGQQDYAQLPSFLAGWDVCLLPFARNEATRFISPTKMLEYMAAERPIVSTPITDVAQPYGEIVYLAETSPAFIDACEDALLATPEQQKKRIEKMREVLSHTSWDATVEAMSALIDTSIRQHHLPSAAAALLREQPSTFDSGDNERPFSEQNSPDPELLNNHLPHPRTIVLGAGPTGLSAAYHLGADSLLLERNTAVGGWCRSVEDKGFTFDYAGHIMFSNDPYVHELYKLLLGDNIHWQEREAWVYSQQVYTRYPFQGALYGLPPDVIKDCIVGAIEARFGSIPKPTVVAASAGNKPDSKSGNGSSASACKAESITDCCADGILEATVPASKSHVLPFPNRRKGARNFEDFIYHVWGAGIAEHFAIPYNRKLWAVPLTEMETSWLGGRVPLPDLEEMIEGALQPVAKPMGPNARFGYPLKGGFQALMNGFVPHLQGQLKLNAQVSKISPSNHRVTLADGTEYPYQSLVSTLPLPELIKLMGDVPSVVRSAAQGLRHVSVRCINLGIGRSNLTNKHWIYYPEDTVFHRIFVQGNASPHCNPPGGFGLTCEISYSPHKPLPCEGAALIQRCITDCIKVGIINASDPVWVANEVDMPYAYVIYDHARLKHVSLIRAWLQEQDIVLARRYSEWEYYNSDHAFIAGKMAASYVQSQQDKAAIAASDHSTMPAVSSAAQTQAASQRAALYSNNNAAFDHIRRSKTRGASRGL